MSKLLVETSLCGGPWWVESASPFNGIGLSNWIDKTWRGQVLTSSYVPAALSYYIHMYALCRENKGEWFGMMYLLPPVDLHWIFEIFSVTWNFFHSEILSLRISKFHFSSNLSFSFQKLRQLTTMYFNASMFLAWKVFVSLCCHLF